MVHGHLLTKSHGVVGCGVAETAAVATNSLFHATFLLRIERAEASQNVLAVLQKSFRMIANPTDWSCPDGSSEAVSCVSF